MIKKILEISNLEASIGNKKIIKNLNLQINENEIHLIMGPNGSGKSTLSKILSGHPAYEINSGKIDYCGENLLEKEINVRAQEGLFLAFQYPLEIAGVTNYDFLRTIYNEKQKYLKKNELDPLEFMKIIQPFLEKLKIKGEFLNRNLNEGFSGGEKKRNEILQMLLLTPKLIILDEIDSGLDIDAMKIIYEAISKIKENNVSLIVVTHNPRVLNYLNPTHIHIMINGRIIKTGNLEIIESLEKEGYDFFLK
jgi:Fe-S cluster assembly ATP-binding protein